MNLTIKQTNLFKKRMKKLPAQQKIELDNAVKTIVKNPYIGDLKKGDLSFLRVYKFQINKQLMLLGYHYKKNEKNQRILTLLQLGSHENFYRDVKRV